MEQLKKIALPVIAGIVGLALILGLIFAETPPEPIVEQEPEPVVAQETSRCVEVPALVISNINESWESEGVTISTASAVKSTAYESVYFISADIEGENVAGDEDIVTFATNKMDFSGMLYSINPLADQYSLLPLGTSTDANLSMADDGAEDSQDCLAK